MLVNALSVSIELFAMFYKDTTARISLRFSVDSNTWFCFRLLFFHIKLNGYTLLQGCRAILIDKDRKPKVCGKFDCVLSFSIYSLMNIHRNRVVSIIEIAFLSFSC